MSFISKSKAQLILKKIEDKSVGDDKWTIVKEFFETQSPSFRILEQSRVRYEAFQMKVLVATNNLVRGIYTEEEFDNLLQESLSMELIPIKEDINAIESDENRKTNRQVEILKKLNESIESFEEALNQVIADDISLVSDEEEKYIQNISEQAITAGSKIEITTRNVLSEIKYEPIIEILEQVYKGGQRISQYISEYQGNDKGMRFAWFNFSLSEFLGSDKLGLVEECYEELTTLIDCGGLDDETVGMLNLYKSLLGDYIQGLHVFKNKIRVLQEKE